MPQTDKEGPQPVCTTDSYFCSHRKDNRGVWSPRWGNKGEGRLLTVLHLTIFCKPISLSYPARSHQCFLYISSPQNPIHPFKSCFLVLFSDIPHATQVAAPSSTLETTVFPFTSTPFEVFASSAGRARKSVWKLVPQQTTQFFQRPSSLWSDLDKRWGSSPQDCPSISQTCDLVTTDSSLENPEVGQRAISSPWVATKVEPSLSVSLILS